MALKFDKKIATKQKEKKGRTTKKEFILIKENERTVKKECTW